MSNAPTSLVLVHPFGLDVRAQAYMPASGRSYLRALDAEVAAADDLWIAAPRIEVQNISLRVNRQDARVIYTQEDGHQLTSQTYGNLTMLLRPNIRIAGGFFFYNGEPTGCAGEFAKSLARQGANVTIVAPACFTEETYRPPRKLVGLLGNEGYLSRITVSR